MSDQLTTDEGRKRDPRYKVFEGQEMYDTEDARGMLEAVAMAMGADRMRAMEAADRVLAAGPATSTAWVSVGSDIRGATDRKAITAVIGTPENPVDGFDAERRLLPHAAVLVAQWHERKLTPTKTEPTAEERAELLRQRDVIERRLAGTVVEEWDG